jgi:hypothetical protein
MLIGHILRKKGLRVINRQNLFSQTPSDRRLMQIQMFTGRKVNSILSQQPKQSPSKTAIFISRNERQSHIPSPLQQL